MVSVQQAPRHHDPDMQSLVGEALTAVKGNNFAKTVSSPV